MSATLDSHDTISDAVSNSGLRRIESPLWPALLALLGTYLVITCWNLHIQTIENPDEPRYAVPARIMLRSSDSNDWLVPKFNTKPRLVKPILYYWLIAATGGAAQKLGLDMVTGFRLGSVLMGMLAVAGTYLLGRRLLGSRAAFLAAGMLMTSRFFHDVARELVVDMTLTAFVVMNCVFCRAALDRLAQNRPAFLPLLGFYLCAGLACATKGPALVAIFIVAPLLAYLAWTGNLRCLWRAGMLWGAPLSLALGLGWMIWLQTHGYDMIGVLKSENVARAVGGKDHQKYTPFLFYIVNLGENFLPWVLLVPLAVWRTIMLFKVGAAPASLENEPLTHGGIGGPRSISVSEEFKYLLCFLAVPFLILGVVVSKRPLYLLPLYPALALWVAWAWDDALQSIEGTAGGRRWAIFLKAAAAGVVIACIAFVAVQPKIGIRDVELALAILLCFAIAAGLWSSGRSLAAGHGFKSALQVIAVGTALVIASEAIARPVRERAAGRVNFYSEMCARLDGRRVVSLGDTMNEAVWYLDRPRELIDNIRYPDLNARFFDVPGMVLLVSTRELEDTPKLKEALKPIGPPMRRGKDKYVLALPDPEHPPDPSVFEKKNKRAERNEE